MRFPVVSLLIVIPVSLRVSVANLGAEAVRFVTLAQPRLTNVRPCDRPYTLRPANHRVKRLLYTIRNPAYGGGMTTLSPSRLRVLRALDGQRSIRQLGALLGGVSPNAIHEQLRNAKRDGLAAPHGKERVSRRWRLTAQGKRVVAALASVGL